MLLHILRMTWLFTSVVGSDTMIDEITISWPSGIVQTLTDVGVNQMITVTETATAPGDLFTDVTSC